MSVAVAPTCPRCGSIMYGFYNGTLRCIRGHALSEGEYLLEGLKRGGDYALRYLNRLESLIKDEREKALDDMIDRSFEATLVYAGDRYATFEVRGYLDLSYGDILGVIVEDPPGQVKVGKIGYVVEYNVEEGLIDVVLWSRSALPAIAPGYTLELTKADTLESYDAQLAIVKSVKEAVKKGDVNLPAYRLLTGGARIAKPSRDCDPMKSVDTLDECQTGVLDATLTLEDNGLILVIGPPGSGKTRTIAETARRLAERGQRVLVLSHTNVAVDNALERLLDLGFERVYRVGRPSKVSDRLKPYMIDERARMMVWNEIKDLYAKRSQLLTLYRKTLAGCRKMTQRHSRMQCFRDLKRMSEDLYKIESKIARILESAVERLLKRLASERGIVVGSTILKALITPHFSAMDFDTVIVDEASQVSVPLLLAAPMFGGRIIVVGDNRQLPPVFRSLSADRMDLLEAFGGFDALIKVYGEGSAFWLRGHYRSHPDIISLASRTFYGGRLVIKTRADKMRLVVHTRCMGDPIGGPEPAALAVDVKGRQEGYSGSYINREEVDAVASIVARLARCVKPSLHSLAVITPYKAQARLLGERLVGLKRQWGPNWPFREEHPLAGTVDSFQGKERDIIIYSAVATEPRQLNFASNPRRLNVAVTRARRKLIVVANLESLRTHGGDLALARLTGEMPVYTPP